MREERRGEGRREGRRKRVTEVEFSLMIETELVQFTSHPEGNSIEEPAPV
jgi:hypothetical protein